jgi:outer membrane protein
MRRTAPHHRPTRAEPRPGRRRGALRRGAAVALLGAATLAPTAARAQAAGSLPLWEVGLAALSASQQAYPGAAEQTQRTLLLPFGIYRGQFLRAERDSVGVRAIVTPEFDVDLGFGAALGSSSSRIEARRGMPDLGDRVEAGPRLRWNLGPAVGGGTLRAEFALRGVFDLSDRFAYQGLSFDPRLVFERQARGGWRYATTLGAIFGDRSLASTLYGVDPIYATADRPAFAASAGLIATRLTTSVSYRVTGDVGVFAFVRVESVEGAANQDSPLVRERTGASIGVGLTYTLRSSRSVAHD